MEFWTGFVVGGLVLGVAGLLVGANNSRRVKDEANAVKDKAEEKINAATR